MMKAYLLLVVAGLASLYIKTCEAGYCTQSYSCPSTCYRLDKYKTSCGSWWRSTCYKTRKQAYSCSKVCYRRVCCKGYTGTGCTTPICFGSTTCPNGGKCIRPDYCTCLPGYASPRCSVCLSSRLPTVTNGEYTQNSGFKSVASLTCKAGYEARGAAGTVVCQSNGYWTRSSGSCQPRNCGSLPSVSNGQFKPIVNSVSLYAVAQFQCSDGYFQFPASPNPYKIKCGTSGLWYPISSTISCKLTDCGPPTATLNGGTYDIVNGTLFGNQAVLTCNETHVLQGKPTFIQCQASGKWSSSSAICVPTCPVGWIDHETSCYLFGKIEMNYTTARQLCLDNDANLVQVESVSENDFLKGEMMRLAENDNTTERMNGYWNDLFEDTINGKEVWRETNTTLDPTVSDWNGNQPDDHGGQQSCTMFWKDFQYQWADIECDAIGKPDRASDRLGRSLCEREKMVQG